MYRCLPIWSLLYRYYNSNFFSKWFKNILRTFEGEIAQNLRTPSFNLKNVVLIKKNVYSNLISRVKNKKRFFCILKSFIKVLWFLFNLVYVDKRSVKKSESWAAHLSICWLFLSFYSNNMQNDKWKFDFRHVRCLFYHLETILIRF